MTVRYYHDKIIPTVGLEFGERETMKKYNPRETYNKILEVSINLFAEKGYENTTMQDIVNASGMSKGAIFHHFKSKEDVFNATRQQEFEYMEKLMRKSLAEKENCTAKEKLQGLLLENLSNEEIISRNSKFAKVLIKSPKLIIANVEGNFEKAAPVIAEIIREGIADGSFATDFPDQCAEVFLLLFNIWADTSIFLCDLSTMRKRLEFVQHMMKELGVDIVTDEVIDAAIKQTEIIGLTVEEYIQKSSDLPEDKNG